MYMIRLSGGRCRTHRQDREKERQLKGLGPSNIGKPVQCFVMALLKTPPGVDSSAVGVQKKMATKSHIFLVTSNRHASLYLSQSRLSWLACEVWATIIKNLPTHPHTHTPSTPPTPNPPLQTLRCLHNPPLDPPPASCPPAPPLPQAAHPGGSTLMWGPMMSSWARLLTQHPGSRH